MQSWPKRFYLGLHFVHGHVATMCSTRQNYSLCREVWKRIKGLASPLAESTHAVNWAIVSALRFPTPWIWTYALLCWSPPGWMPRSSECVCVMGKFDVFCQWLSVGRCMAALLKGRKVSDKYCNLTLPCFIAFLFLALLPFYYKLWSLDLESMPNTSAFKYLTALHHH